MVRQHHRLNGHESEQTPENGDGQGSLACCTPWGHKELDMTERLEKSKYLLDAQTGPGTLMAAESTKMLP